MNYAYEKTYYFLFKGLNSIVNFFQYGQKVQDGQKQITRHFIENFKTSRVLLNRHVKSISYDTNLPDVKNKIVYVYENNLKEFTKTYDYVIITFPLTKDIKTKNFSLDILYRDFLDCEMNHLYNYLVDGMLTFVSSSSIKSNRLFNLFTQDKKLKVQSIQTHLPINCDKNLKYDTAPLLYSVSSIKKINSKVLDCLFAKGYTVIKRMQTNFVPLYKKVKYSHTPFPQVVIDGHRSRVFYLNGLEWLESSKEINCISARYQINK
jgi:hypothetical protein